MIIAARIAAQASGGEILVSGLVKELTRGSAELCFGEIREIYLKGISEPQRVVSVAGQGGA